MLKLIRLALPTLFLLLALSPLTAASTNSKEQSLLTVDVYPYDTILPKRFRTTDGYLSLKHVDTNGLKDLHCIGSGAFTKKQLTTITKLVPDPIIILDLRQESHGYLNGLPISWYGDRNWANLGKSTQKIEREEFFQLKSLERKKTAFLHAILGKNSEGQIQYTKSFPVVISKVESERHLANSLGLKYKRFPVVDHRPPTGPEIDAFISFAKRIPKNSWLYFHCRGGVGRTTTFMIMYDILKNGKEVELQDILLRQHLIGGKDLSTTTTREDSYKYTYSVERVKFIKSFYQYVKDNNDNFTTSWSKWKKNKLSTG